MTSPSLSWTDRAHVARLLDALDGTAAPPARPASSISHPRSSAEPSPKATHAPLPVVPPPVVSPPVVPPPVRATPELILPSTGIADRLDALLDWAAEVVGTPAVFVADEQGLTLAAIGVSDAVVSVVGPLMGALGAARMIPGVQGRMGSVLLDEDTLCWADAITSRGTFCIGVVARDVLPNAQMRVLSRALTRTLAD